MAINKPEVIFHSQKNAILFDTSIWNAFSERLRMNFENPRHGCFRQHGQLDNPEIVLQNSWQSGRIYRFSEGHCYLPHEEKRFSVCTVESLNGTLFDFSHNSVSRSPGRRIQVEYKFYQPWATWIPDDYDSPEIVWRSYRICWIRNGWNCHTCIEL